MNQNTRQRSSTDASSDNKLQRLQSRPRPTPKKAQSSSGQIETGIRPPAQSSEPPQVPPRQWSISSPDRDLNSATAVGDKGGEDVLSGAAAAFSHDPFSPSSANENFADFSSEFGKPLEEPFHAPPSHPIEHHSQLDSAISMQPVLLPTVTAPRKIEHQYSIRDKREIQHSIRAQRERNTMLVRVNNELHQELQEVMEQRISLEIQLEHLKPC